MAKIKFRTVRLSKENKSRLEAINSIIEEYQEEGYTLTLRQLYYQLVSRDVVPNKQSEYSKLSTLLKEGRMGGIVDWDAIEDRLRKPQSPSSFESPKSILDACIEQYELPRQGGQKTYIEVWVEKDALSGVLKRVTEKYHVPILVNRGYSSVSAMFDSYERFSRKVDSGKKILILYLGDFDPSGMDMIRDIKDRITEFFKKDAIDIFETLDISVQQEMYDTVYNQYNEHEVIFSQAEIAEITADEYFKLWVEENFIVKPIALTKEQINLYNPPPNPAKITDPRAKEFIKKHGATSWEVDALKPEVLNSLLTRSIEDNMNMEAYNSIVNREIDDIKKLRELKNLL